MTTELGKLTLHDGSVFERRIVCQPSSDEPAYSWSITTPDGINYSNSLQKSYGRTFIDDSSSDREALEHICILNRGQIFGYDSSYKIHRAPHGAAEIIRAEQIDLMYRAYKERKQADPT